MTAQDQKPSCESENEDICKEQNGRKWRWRILRRSKHEKADEADHHFQQRHNQDKTSPTADHNLPRHSDVSREKDNEKTRVVRANPDRTIPARPPSQPLL